MIGNLLLAGAVALAQPSPEPKPPTGEQVVKICREVYIGNEQRGRAMFQALPNEYKAAVALFCQGYGVGLRDNVPLRPERGA